MPPYLNDYDKDMLRAFPGTEFARVFYMLLDYEIEQEQESFDDNAKVSNDPIREDWRCKLGQKIGLKRARYLVEKYTINNQNGG